MITKPMLAGKCENVATLQYPVAATPKLDGIRCLVVKQKAVTRKFLAIPNDHIRDTIEASLGYYTLDGEIMIPGRSFNELSGDVRRKDGKPDFRYHVFDHVPPLKGLREAYALRIAELTDLLLPDWCVKVIPRVIHTVAELEAYEMECLAQGYEGVMVRTVDSPYKCGRATVGEGYLLKIKRFEDSEAEVIGFDCEYENQNIAERDAFGRTKRASNQENLVPKNRLGKLSVRDLKTGVEFDIGTGFSHPLRIKLWSGRDSLKGEIVKYKHQPTSGAEKPRFPVFLGFRMKEDL